MKDCSDVIDALGRGGELSPAQHAHAQQCPSCHALVDFDAQLIEACRGERLVVKCVVLG